MSQGFKFKYTEMREGNPASQHETPKTETYATETHVRNICFVWPNGYRIFLNYSYLIAGEFLPEENKIVLSFTTHIITLMGIRLESLYTQFMHHLAMHITCIEDRYIEANDPEIPIVNHIAVASVQ